MEVNILNLLAHNSRGIYGDALEKENGLQFFTGIVTTL